MVADSKVRDDIVIKVSDVWKRFRLYHEKSMSFKEAILRRKRGSYEDFWALKNISFEVEKGATLGIIGENGSGKSTTLKLLTRILKPEKGAIEVNGRVSALLELGAGFHPELTGRENIYLNGAILGLKRQEVKERFDDIVSFAELEKFIDTPVKSYSSGMYMRLGFAIAVNVDPDILFIDEVLAVGDKAFQRRCYRQIERFQKEGKTIVFVSHDLEAIKKVCDTAILLDGGEIKKRGGPNEVVNTYSELVSMREIERAKEFAASTRRTGQVFAPDSDLAGLEGLMGSGGEYRFGFGDAKIIDFEIVGSNGKVTTEITSGEECTVRAHILFHCPAEDPVVGMTIKNPVGVEIYGTNTWYEGKQIGAQKADSKIVVEFKQNLWLNDGTYMISLGVADLLDGRVKPLDLRLDVLSFRVLKKKMSIGFVDLRSDIRVRKE